MLKPVPKMFTDDPVPATVGANVMRERVVELWFDTERTLPTASYV